MVDETLSLDTLLEGSPTAAIAVDAQYHIHYANEAAVQLFHTQRDDLLNMALRQLNQSSDVVEALEAFTEDAQLSAEASTHRLSLVSGDGLHHYRVTFSPIDSHIALFFQDVSDLVEMEKSLKDQATHDTLTGLFNRRQLFTIGSQDVARVKRYRTPYSILIVSIANIRDINQTYGYVMGDHALICVARTLQEQLRESDYVARLDNKSFVVCLIDATLEQTSLVEKRILNALGQRKVRIADSTIPIKIATGAAEFQAETDQLFDDLLLRAEHEEYEREQKMHGS